MAGISRRHCGKPQSYRDRVTLYLGGKEIQVLHVGRAHTRGDSIIYVPQDRIAYSSELFFSDQFLFINDGYGLDWLKALDAVAALSANYRRVEVSHSPIRSTASCISAAAPA